MSDAVRPSDGLSSPSWPATVWQAGNHRYHPAHRAHGPSGWYGRNLAFWPSIEHHFHRNLQPGTDIPPGHQCWSSRRGNGVRDHSCCPAATWLMAGVGLQIGNRESGRTTTGIRAIRNPASLLVAANSVFAQSGSKIREARGGIFRFSSTECTGPLARRGS
jgi:hypothetical protein